MEQEIDLKIKFEEIIFYFKNSFSHVNKTNCKIKGRETKNGIGL